MNGELGVLYQEDKQVGGLYDWEIITISQSTVRDGWYDFKVAKEITARSYWLIVTPDGSIFEVKFYKAIRGQLILVDKGITMIDLPDKTLDHRLYIPLEIMWIGN